MSATRSQVVPSLRRFDRRLAETDVPLSPQRALD